ncbi:MAG: UDP-glucose dehydrogenase family protein [Planctomycetota bacterium]
MKICVVGTGYVGLVVGTCLSDTGQFVTCVDKDPQIVETLSQGTPTIYESGLAELLQRNIQAGRLDFTTDLDASIADANIVFVAVGTPPLPDGSVDMSAIEAVTRQIAKAAKNHLILVMKSTVPVGTYKKLGEILAQESQLGVDYVSNPEFLKEGNAVADFTKPDRVVLGSTNPQAAKTIAHLYSAYMRQSERVVLTDPASAEMAKYASNTMLAMRISFMNEVSRLCDACGADVEAVRRTVGSDKRIGPAFLFPGLGYGGFCFPKDVQALASLGRQHDVPMALAEATTQANHAQLEYFKSVIDRHFRGDYKGKTVAVWGLAYKAKTDDTRMSHAVKTAAWLAEQGATVRAHDPQAMEKAKADLGGSINFCDEMYAALDGADALVVMTDWTEFRNPDLDQLRQRMKSQVIIDGRNMYDPAETRASGFVYHSIGRPTN